MLLKVTPYYAIQSVCYIAMQKKHSIVNTQEMFNNTQASRHYLPRVLKALDRGGILNCFRGVDGGYQLNDDPENISVWDIIQCFETERGVEETSYEVLMEAEEEVKKIYKNISIESLISG